MNLLDRTAFNDLTKGDQVRATQFVVNKLLGKKYVVASETDADTMGAQAIAKSMRTVVETINASSSDQRSEKGREVMNVICFILSGAIYFRKEEEKLRASVAVTNASIARLVSLSKRRTSKLKDGGYADLMKKVADARAKLEEETTKAERETLLVSSRLAQLVLATCPCGATRQVH
jgi:hypothetical protein